MPKKKNNKTNVESQCEKNKNKKLMKKNNKKSKDK